MTRVQAVETNNAEIACTYDSIELDADVQSALELACDDVVDPCKIAVNLKLSPNVEVSLSRRGRKRFHELQANNPEAKIRFDRRRQILRVAATEAGITSVRRQLEALDALTKPVPAAVWHELMRTRVEDDVSKSLLLQLQQQSGCRIHIERGQHEVRIFGPDEETVIADRLLDELAAVCVEDKVPVLESTCICPSTLQFIAETCEVTIKAHRGTVMVYGRRQAVADAVEELQQEYVNTSYVDTDDEFDGTMSLASSDDLFAPLPFSRASTAASDYSHPVQSQAVPVVKVTSCDACQAARPPDSDCHSVTSGSAPPSPRQMMAVPSGTRFCQPMPVTCFGAMLPMPAQPCLAMLVPVYASSPAQSRSPSPCPSQ